MVTQTASARPIRPLTSPASHTFSPCRLPALWRRETIVPVRVERAGPGSSSRLVAKASDEISAQPQRISSWDVEDGIADAHVELLVSGLSVSPSGFVCLLGPEMCSVADPSTSLEAVLQQDCLVLPVQVTSGGCDRKQAESIEALTLLQLVQGIDVGVRLPYEALMNACPGVPDGSMLHEVILQEVPDLGPSSSQTECLATAGDYSAPPGFTASLRVDSETFNSESPFDAIALALRYKAPILVPAELLQARGITAPEARESFPDALPVEESTKQAHSITSNICVAWRAAATPIGDDDIMALRKQLRSDSTNDGAGNQD